MQRFLVTPQTLAADTVVLQGSTSRQIAVVLRMRTVDKVILSDGQGGEALCQLEDVTARRVVLRVLERSTSTAEAVVRLHLYPALLRAPRFEMVLQKATELGVVAITPVLCRRSVARPSDAGVPERWRSIVREAFEQSGRGFLPVVAEPISLLAGCSAASQADLALCCSEHGGADLTTLVARHTPRTVAAMIGPEGGLDAEEVALASHHGLHAVTLGPRILRAETAAIALCAAVFCLSGDWSMGARGRGRGRET